MLPRLPPHPVGVVNGFYTSIPVTGIPRHSPAEQKQLRHTSSATAESLQNTIIHFHSHTPTAWSVTLHVHVGMCMFLTGHPAGQLRSLSTAVTQLGGECKCHPPVSCLLETLQRLRHTPTLEEHCSENGQGPY